MPKTNQKTLNHLDELLEMVDSLSEVERNARWIPNKGILKALRSARLRQKERVAVVIAAYAKDHGGDSPPWSVVGDVLGIGKSTAYSYGLSLAAETQRRGRFLHHAFYLSDASYNHPLLDLAKLLSDIDDD